MAAIIYLDPEDEITSAAARIRTARDRRVVLVLPFGSRLATSRINFRLLAREAEAMSRRLDIVAPDAAARALAISAGLAAYASVAELDEEFYEGAPATTGPAASSATVTPADGTTGVRATGGSGIRRARDAGPDTGATPGRGTFLGLGGLPTRSGVDAGAARGGAGSGGSSSRGRSWFRPSRLIALVIAVIVLGGGGLAGWTVLPAADITIIPRVSPVGPLTVVVHADPAATAVDPSGGVIPATTVDIPVSVSGDFKATGKRVDETKASGQVRFDSINTVFVVSVPQGTRVSTLDGILFATTAAVSVPRATVSGTTIQHGFATVGIGAIKAGTAANVGAGTITEVPGSLATQQVGVTNPAATTGGTHTETALVTQADVDGALTSLRKQLTAAFAAAAAAPADVPAGATVFAGTATSGEPLPDPQPATLVGKAMASFSMRLSASGSVLAVDATPVRSIADARLRSTIDGQHTLLPASVSVTIGEGSVTDGVVSFTARASASEVLNLDPAALRQNVLGMSRVQAEAMLGQYGDVTLGLWPDWVADVPGIDARVTLTVVPADGTSASPAPSPAPSASSPPSGTPGS
jgi:hypothetical protein